MSNFTTLICYFSDDFRKKMKLNPKIRGIGDEAFKN